MSETYKRKILLSVLAVILTANMMIYNIPVFLPLYVTKRNDQNDWDTESEFVMDTNKCALIIAIFELVQVISAPFNYLIKNYLGAKNTIQLGFGILTITTFGLGLISMI